MFWLVTNYIYVVTRMLRADKTTMGGSREMFQTTCWTEIISAKTTDQAQQKLIINNLLSRYWKPVYCYLRRKGHSNESAKDLTQGFFTEIVLGRKLFTQADRIKGKFRTFLLTALDRYTADIYRRESAEKRRPSGNLYSLGDIEPSETLLASQDASAEDSFNHAWVADLLERVFSEVKQECQRTGKEIYWKVFDIRLIGPIIACSKPPSLEEIKLKFNIDSEKTVSNMIITVKRRLYKTLERHLKQMTGENDDIMQEIDELQKLFSS